MKFAKASEAVEYKNNPECTAREYELGETDINGAVIMLNGRYPQTKRAYNTVSKELIQVLEGSGIAVVEDREIDLAIADQLIIEPYERYSIEGTLKLFIASTPAWTPDQARNGE